MEHYRPSKKRMEYDFSALNMAKKGQFIPIPINELGSFHWSGIDQRAITIDRSKLISNPGYTKKSSLPKKYFKLIK